MSFRLGDKASGKSNWDKASVQRTTKRWKKTLPLVEGSSTYRGYPGGANLSDISLQSVARRVHEKKTFAPLEGSPS